MSMIKRLSKDTFSGFVFLLGVIVLAWESIKIKNSQSAMFVFLVLGGMFISTIFIIISGIRSKQNDWKLLAYKKKELMILAILILSYFLIKVIGFYSVIFIITLSVYLIVEGIKDKKDVLNALIYTIVLTAFIVLVCTYVLKISFPSGILF